MRRKQRKDVRRRDLELGVKVGTLEAGQAAVLHEKKKRLRLGQVELGHKQKRS